MTTIKIFVFDTNSLISAFLVRESPGDFAFRKAISEGMFALSESLISEFIEVLWRTKFDKYFSEEERPAIVLEVLKNATIFSTTEKIIACNDPDDNMVLELAVASQANCIISGDKNLLKLHPFRGIPILSSADFLKTFF